MAAVLDNQRAGEAAAAGIAVGGTAAALWPVAVLWGVLYVPLKVVEKATRKERRQDE